MSVECSHCVWQLCCSPRLSSTRVFVSWAPRVVAMIRMDHSIAWCCAILSRLRCRVELINTETSDISWPSRTSARPRRRFIVFSGQRRASSTWLGGQTARESCLRLRRLPPPPLMFAGFSGRPTELMRCAHNSLASCRLFVVDDHGAPSPAGGFNSSERVAWWRPFCPGWPRQF